MKLKLILFFLFGVFYPIFSQINYTYSVQNTAYSSLLGGTAAPLSPAFLPTKTALDEGFSNNISLGFSFQYNGENYTSIHLNTNGFASLGAPFLAANFNPNYHINELRNAVEYKGAIRPILAPLWDDLLLSSASDLTYKTEGIAPNRVFTAQWYNTIWQNGTAAISFQLKLHETTNIVSFHYHPESGLIDTNASASIGITSSKAEMPDIDMDLPYFLSLNSLQNTATVSEIFETETINNKPVADQEFRFTPKLCTAPANIKLQQVTTTSATISWVKELANSNYNVAVSNIDVLPFASTLVAVNNQVFNNLVPNTEYFCFIKNECGTSWTRFKFKTASLENLPYSENFETALDGSLPKAMLSQNTGNNFAEMQWQTTDLLASASGAIGTKKAINSSRFTNSNSWLFTPSFQFLAGATYNLSFKYSSTAATNLGAKFNATNAAVLQVKYGLGAGEAAMQQTITSINSLNNSSYITQNVSFTPSLSGEYNIGFGYQADVSDAIFILDEISLTQTSAPLPLNLLSFEAKLNPENLVELNWQTTAEQNLSHFEIERSLDGKLFEQFGKTNANNNNGEKNLYEYYDRTPTEFTNSVENMGIYYRLKMIDFDGKFSYSPIRYVKLKENFATILYPNPSGKTVFLKVQNAPNTVIKVFDLQGKLLPINKDVINDNELKISLLDASVGVYLVNIQSNTETRILKWIVR